MIKRFLISIIKQFKISLFVFFLISGISWAVNLIIPYIMGIFIDSLRNEGDVEIIYKITAITIFLSLVAIVCAYFANIKMTKISSQMAYDLKERLFKHVLGAKQIEITRIDSSYLSQKIVSDTEAIINFLIENSMEFFLKGMTIIVVIFYLAKINVTIALILFIFIPIYTICFITFKRPLYDSSYKMKEAQNRFFASIVHRFNNIYHIKINSLNCEVISELREEYYQVLNRTLIFTKIAFVFSSLGSSISMLSRIILIFFGGIQIIKGNLSIGEFTVINTYYSALIASVDYYLKFGRNFQNIIVSYKRLEELITLDRERNGEYYPDSVYEIKLKNVNFGYLQSEQLFHNISCKFVKGTIYCICGENGIGKTSLINLLLGIYQPISGEILINGISYSKVNFEIMRKDIFSVCEQNAILFRNIVIENIEYGIKISDWEKIPYLLKKFEIDNILTIHDKEGSHKELSGGERQKIALIHALVKKAEVFIFDEPTNFLDKKSIELLCEELILLKRNTIVIIVSHNSRMQEIADEVIKIEK